MPDKNTKPGRNPDWAIVGDSAEGIRNLRPDVLKQKMDQAKAIDAHIKQNGIPSAKSEVSPSAQSKTTKTLDKGK